MQIPVRIEVLDDTTRATHQHHLAPITNQFQGILQGCGYASGIDHHIGAPAQHGLDLGGTITVARINGLYAIDLFGPGPPLGDGIDPDDGVGAGGGIQTGSDLANHAHPEDRHCLPQNPLRLYQRRKREAGQREHGGIWGWHVRRNRPDIGIGTHIDHGVAFVTPWPNHAVPFFELGHPSPHRHDVADGAITGHKGEFGPQIRRIFEPLMDASVDGQLGAGTNPTRFGGNHHLIGTSDGDIIFNQFDGELFGHYDA